MHSSSQLQLLSPRANLEDFLSGLRFDGPGPPKVPLTIFWLATPVMSQSLQRRRRHTDIYYLLCCPNSCLDDYNENVLEGHDKRLSTRASAKTIFLRLVQSFSYVQQEEAHLPMYSQRICVFTIWCCNITLDCETLFSELLSEKKSKK